MSRPPLARVALLAATLAAAGALAACGKTGELARPKPLFGHAKAGAPEASAKRQGQDPSQPIQTIDPRDVGRGDSPVPSRQDPIQGQSPDPLGVAPPTNMPNPYARPGS
jgi:hypothetical protein